MQNFTCDKNYNSEGSYRAGDSETYREMHESIDGDFNIKELSYSS